MESLPLFLGEEAELAWGVEVEAAMPESALLEAVAQGGEGAEEVESELQQWGEVVQEVEVALVQAME